MVFLNDHCREEQVEAVLVSLDAKKAFDSVDHVYIENTLMRYGFGPKLIKFFKTIYKNISARILINGHLSDTVKIYRGFKQGVAFSCGIFITSIDPIIKLESVNQFFTFFK